MRKSFQTIAFICMTVLPGAASASVVDFSGVGLSLSMGSLVAGQTGSISYTAPGAAVHITEGALAAQTMLVFSYTFNNTLKNSASNAIAAAYNYNMGGDQYTGGAISYQSTPPTLFLNGDASASTVNGAASAALLFATANLIKGENTAQVAITNNSMGVAGFINTMTLLFNNPRISSLTYSVTALSSVPLPAALPMFASLLAGMFGFSRVRRTLA